MKPVVDALRQLGGSGSIGEIATTEIDTMKLPASLTEVLHDPEVAQFCRTARRSMTATMVRGLKPTATVIAAATRQFSAGNWKERNRGII